jgi:hypothetical protein
VDDPAATAVPDAVTVRAATRAVVWPDAAGPGPAAVVVPRVAVAVRRVAEGDRPVGDATATSSAAAGAG